MREIKLFIALIILNIVLFSCSSDDNSDTQETNPTEINKLVKIEKISDSIKSEYIYNADNLLITWNGTRTSFGYEINFIYDSNKKITEYHHQESGSGTYSNDTFFTYDDDGNLINYEAIDIAYSGNLITATGDIGGNQSTTLKLEVTNNLISKLIEIDNYTTFEYDSEGNLIIVKNYNTDDMLLMTYFVEYDQKINPFYGQMKSLYVERFIEAFYPFNGVYVTGFEGYFFPFFKNNIVSISKYSSEFRSYNYTYDNENYPTSVVEYYANGNVFHFEIDYY